MYIRFVEIHGNWSRLPRKYFHRNKERTERRLGKYSQRPKEITVVVIARAYDPSIAVG